MMVIWNVYKCPCEKSQQAQILVEDKTSGEERDRQVILCPSCNMAMRYTGWQKGPGTGELRITIAKDPPKIVSSGVLIENESMTSVRKAAIAMLHEAHELARKEAPPGDGSMRFFSDLPDRDINDGKWEPNGWTLQACFLVDSRLEIKGPQVVVHAYHGDSFTKGSVARAIEYTSEDERALKVKRLETLLGLRTRLDQEIAKLEVSPDYAEGYAKAREDIMSLAGQGSAFGRMHRAERKVEEDTALLESLEWSGVRSGPITDACCCPICHGVRPSPELSGFPEEAIGHLAVCGLGQRLGREAGPSHREL